MPRTSETACLRTHDSARAVQCSFHAHIRVRSCVRLLPPSERHGASKGGGEYGFPSLWRRPFWCPSRLRRVSFRTTATRKSLYAAALSRPCLLVSAARPTAGADALASRCRPEPPSARPSPLRRCRRLSLERARRGAEAICPSGPARRPQRPTTPATPAVPAAAPVGPVAPRDPVEDG
jgi:hypothetical protein